MPIVKKIAKDTLTAVELDRDDTLHFTLRSGAVWTMQLLSTSAQVTQTNLKQLKVPERTGRTNYHFTCSILVNGTPHTLEREVSSQKSFYDPWLLDGVHLWFDAVVDIFDFLNEAHGDCKPRRHARFALQDATLGICPEPLHPWCPLPPDGLKIEMCYTGEDCWLGAYQGADAHGGLDINHPPGTPLWAPLDIHDHFYFNSLEMGHNNNRWRGIHHWPNGSQWILQAHHMTRLLLPEHTRSKRANPSPPAPASSPARPTTPTSSSKSTTREKRSCSTRGSCSGRCIGTVRWKMENGKWEMGNVKTTERMIHCPGDGAGPC